MSLTNDQLLDRIAELEESLETLSTALNNLASRKELKNLVAILTNQITSVSEELTQIEQTAIGEALNDHIVSSTPHASLDSRYYLQSAFTATSVGVADAGKPVLLSSSGVLDGTVLPGNSWDHGGLGGLLDDDHTQYLTDSRADAWALSNLTVQSGISHTHSRSHELDSVADHAAASSANYGKYLRANVATGAIEFGTIASDHSDLTGLSDDDHTQYHNDTRGDARYFTEAEHIDTSVGAGDAGKPIKLNNSGLLDPSMLTAAEDPVTATASVALTSTQITGTSTEQLGHADGVTLVPAVAGKRIHVLQWCVVYTFNTAAYTGGSNIQLFYPIAGASAADGQITAASSLTAGNSRTNWSQGWTSNKLFTNGFAIGDPLAINASSSAFTNPGTAAGTATVTVLYALMDA
jgi:hypothetical protein